MVAKEVESICADIRSLKIQGARNVAKAAVKALALQARASSASSVREAYSELLEAADALASTRPTEPMLRNALRNAVRHALARINSRKISSVRELKSFVALEEKNYLRDVEQAVSAIAEYGARLVLKNGVVFTHCHSNTVMAVLKRAFELKRLSSVICTETRPRFQGRLTARELSNAGIPVTFIVDSAVKAFIDDVDVVFVGADAITSKGDLVNKIGTATIAAIAFQEDIPFYSASEIFKFDPLTLWGVMEEIEERDAGELVDVRDFPKVKIRNPAFDLTLAKYISAFVTDVGVVAPQGLAHAVSKQFPNCGPLEETLKQDKV
ncbi:S-methyl-5-thioribose-1-phosphate isomerase [Candidatus Micrarchaeota archaeon]|nr:S-methyl-5-thioribose-1-phosphate isomerase [Candidatus Micrarchaeota archaeon]